MCDHPSFHILTNHDLRQGSAGDKPPPYGVSKTHARTSIIIRILIHTNFTPQKSSNLLQNPAKFDILIPYGFEIIDLYNNNILNSHDKDVNEQFVPDGVHCNPEGYRILAEHIASQIIQRIEQ